MVADGGEVVLRLYVRTNLRDAPGDRGDRLPLPRLLHQAVGPVRPSAVGRAGPFDALAGAGVYDEQDGERCRVKVTLATGIPEEAVRRANLDYLDPASIDLEEYAADPTPSLCRGPAKYSTGCARDGGTIRGRCGSTRAPEPRADMLLWGPCGRGGVAGRDLRAPSRPWHPAKSPSAPRK
ncbi:hypothetical protein ACU686_27685 [Yinghuangia aomiensis]